STTKDSPPSPAACASLSPLNASAPRSISASTTPRTAPGSTCSSRPSLLVTRYLLLSGVPGPDRPGTPRSFSFQNPMTNDPFVIGRSAVAFRSRALHNRWRSASRWCKALGHAVKYEARLQYGSRTRHDRHPSTRHISQRGRLGGQHLRPARHLASLRLRPP